MTEIKLTRRYPQSRTEDIVDAYMRGWNDALDAVQNGKFIINDDRKTEPNCSEIPNNCEWSVEYAKKMLDTMPCEECGHWEHGAGNHYYCALLEMRQECYFEPKAESTLMFANIPQPETEPQTDCKNCNNHDRCVYQPKDEPQPRCPKCGARGYIRSLESMGVKLKVFDEYKWKCTNCNKYFKEKPKDEPQTELVNDSPILAKDLVDDEFNPYDEECMRCKHLKLQCEFVPSYCKYEPRDEPQTEDPPMDEYYKDHDEFYDCDRYVVTNDEGERAYNCIGCEQTDCAWGKGE